ncbi:MAG TPA: ATP-binding cassette domain-containing protein [Solirubrobacterales bacterium]|nr:ATP-binding cassette domain-containing protein [Solirubrobacterales bacterium]
MRFVFDRQRRPVTPAMGRLRRHCETNWGLRGVDVEVGPGESVALLGGNGAGKTTLLKVMAGVYTLDEGAVAVEGRVGSLLSINGGLMPELTGRENAVLLGVLAGLSRPQAFASLESVLQSSRLGNAFERPVSSYSQGMRARLGFATILESRPQVLLLDEVHEALDDDFRVDFERISEEIRSAGGIVVVAGHDHQLLSRMTSRALHLKDASLIDDGPFDTVLGGYLARDRGEAASR